MAPTDPPARRASGPVTAWVAFTLVARMAATRFCCFCWSGSGPIPVPISPDAALGANYPQVSPGKTIGRRGAIAWPVAVLAAAGLMLPMAALAFACCSSWWSLLCRSGGDCWRPAPKREAGLKDSGSCCRGMAACRPNRQPAWAAPVFALVNLNRGCGVSGRHPGVDWSIGVKHA